MEFAKKDPNAMDIDSMMTEQRAEAMKKGLCFGCGKRGHLLGDDTPGTLNSDKDQRCSKARDVKSLSRQ